MKKRMRVIAFAMAFILTFTTFISDSSMLYVRAEEITDESSESRDIVEDTSAGNESEETVATEEKSSSDIVDSNTAAEEKSSQEDTEEVSSGEETSSSDEVASTTAEVTSTEEAATEEITTEEITTEEITTEETTEVVEEQIVILYEASEGGTVSRNKEEVSLIDEEAAVQGATAIADEGYEFINWTKGETEVCTSETFVPEKEEATYVANFKLIETTPAFSQDVDMGDVIIHIKAKAGVFPKGVKAAVDEVTDTEDINKIEEAVSDELKQDEDIAKAFSYDITFSTEEEDNIQPKGTVDVTFEAVNKAADEDVAVFHMDDELANAESMKDQLPSEENQVKVEAEHFSVYVVTLIIGSTETVISDLTIGSQITFSEFLSKYFSNQVDSSKVAKVEKDGWFGPYISDNTAVVNYDTNGWNYYNMSNKLYIAGPGTANIRMKCLDSNGKSLKTITCKIKVEEKIEVILYANGGTFDGGSVTKEIIAENQYLSDTELAAPKSSNGAAFKGWFYIDGTKKATFTKNTKITQSLINSIESNREYEGNKGKVVLYADWSVTQPGNCVDAPAQPSTGGLDPGEVAAHKNAAWVDYDNRIAAITFDLQGIPVNTGSDVVIVMDTSLSMVPDYNRDGIDRLTVAKAATKNMVDSLLGDSSKNNRVAFISFSGSVNETSNFQTNASTVKQVVEGASVSTSTNYNAPLNKAYEFINNRSSKERPAYVVFISDGEPNTGGDYTSVKNKLKGISTIYTVGIQMSSSSVLSSLGTEYFNVTDVSNLNAVLSKVAAKTRIAGTNAIIKDTISDYFELLTSGSYTNAEGKTVSISLPDGAAVSGRDVTIKVGNIIENTQYVTIYVKLKSAYTNEKRTYPTNEDAALSFTNINNTEETRGKDELGSPEVSVASGTITTNYVLVDDNGNYINSEGIKVEDAYKVIISTSKFEKNGSTLLDVSKAGTTYTVTPTAPKGYTLFSSTAQNVMLTTNEPDKTVEFKVKAAKYKLHYDFNGANSEDSSFNTNYQDKLYKAGDTVQLAAKAVVDASNIKKNGYTFQGWTLEEGSDLSNAKLITSVIMNADVNVRAVWTKSTATVTIEYYKQNADGSTYPAIPTDTETVTKNVGETVYDADYASNKSYSGYRYQEDAETSAEVTASGAVLKLHYVKDASQTKTISYTVKHYLEGVYQTGSDTTVSEEVWINAADKVSVTADSIKAKQFIGYKYSNTDPAVNAGDKVDKDTIIEINYVKDAEQTKKVTYIVEQWVEGETAARSSKTYEAAVWVKAEDQITVIADSLKKDAPEGYKFKAYDPAGIKAGDNIASGSIIKVIYEKDDAQIKEAKYTVQHIVNGIHQAKDDVVVKEKVWVNATDLTVTEESLAKNTYRGYKFINYNPSDVKAGDKVAIDGVIKVNYAVDETQTDEVRYTVEHWVEGEKTARDTVEVTDNVWADAPKELRVTAASLAQKDYTGYQFDSYSLAGVAEGTVVADGTVIKALYVKDAGQTKTVRYTVENWVDGTHQTTDDKVVTAKVWVNDTAQLAVTGDSIAKKNYIGYQFDRFTPDVNEGSIVADGTVIKAFYVKDASQTKAVSYTVENWVDGTHQTTDDKVVTAVIWVNDTAELAVTRDSIVEKTYIGYKFAGLTPNVTEGTVVADGTVIKALYVKDETQTKTVSYTVEQWVAGVHQDADKTISKEVWVNDANELKVTADSLAPLNYTGYKFDSYNPTDVKADDTIADKAVIRVNYVKDESQTKALKYTVEHWVAGETAARESIPVSETVWVNAADELTVTEASLETKTYTGYRFDAFDAAVKAGDKVADQTVIKATYVKDNSQTKTISYTVKHYLEGVYQTGSDTTVSEEVWINAADKVSVTADSIKAKQFIGYKYSNTDPAVNAGDKVDKDTIIEINYVKDAEQTKKVTYIVEQWVEGETAARSSKTYEAAVWVKAEDQITVIADSLKKDAPEGYRFKAYDPAGIKAGDNVASGSIIKVIYEKDDAQTKEAKYTVQHIVDGIHQAKDDVVVKERVWVNATDLTVTAESLAQYNYRGYKFINYNPSDVKAGDKVAIDGVIKVNYAIDETQTDEVRYTVEHWVAGETTARDSVVVTDNVWANAPKELSVTTASLSQKDYTGYQFDSYSLAGVAEGTVVADGTVIKALYVKDANQTKTVRYTVENWVDGTHQTTDDKVVTAVIWVNDTAELAVTRDSIARKNYIGYQFDRLTPDVSEGSIVADGTVIKADYVKDESQTKEVSYTVEHWVAGEETARDIVSVKGTVWVNAEADITVTAESLAAKTYTGYQFDKVVNAKAGDVVADKTVVKVMYVKDETQTKTVSYRVEQWVAGVHQDADKTINKEVWVNDANELKVTADSLAPLNYTGYKFDSYNPTDVKADDTIADKAVIRVNYVKDESQTKALKYTVEHWVAGETAARESIPVSETVWVNAADELTVTEASLETKTYTGYKFDVFDTVVKAGDKVADQTVIKAAYVKDDSQTKTISYTVVQWIDGKETAESSQTYSEDVWINAENKLAVTADSLKQEAPTGYKFKAYDPTDIKANDFVNNGTTIKTIYEKDESQTKEVQYTVQHIVNGVHQAKDDVVVKQNVWINATDLTVTSESLAQNAYRGYKFINYNPSDVKAGDKVAIDGVIKLNYAVDETQTDEVKYTVEHWVEGEKTARDSVVVMDNVWANAPKELSVTAVSLAKKDYTGYQFDSYDLSGVAGGTVVADGTVIKALYVKDASQTRTVKYTVENWVDGTHQTTDDKVVTAAIWVNDTAELAVTEESLAKNSYTGYQFDRFTPDVSEGSMVADGTVIKADYVKDESQTKDVSYTVEHWVNGVHQTAADVVVSDKVWVNDKAELAVTGDSLTTNAYKGHTFAYYDPNTITAGTIVTSGMVIKAIYTINRYKVSFAAGPNGSIAAPNVFELEYGTPAQGNVTIPKATADEGYYFAGWSMNDSEPVKDITLPEKIVEDVMVTAIFREQTTITLTADSDLNVIYDGNIHRITSYSGIPNGLKITGYEVNTAGIEAGTYATKIVQTGDMTVTSSEGDVTERYLIKLNDGKLVISPATITITISEGQNKVYGEKEPEYQTVVNNKPVNGVKVNYNVERKAGEDAGLYPLSVIFGDNPNYVMTESPKADFEIIRRPITFTAASASMGYTGNPLTANSYSISGTGLATAASKDSVKSIIVSGSRTQAGRSVNSISNAQIVRLNENGIEENVTDNYTITYVNGELRVYTRDSGGDDDDTTTTTTTTTTPTITTTPEVTPITVIPGAPTPLAVTPPAPVATPNRAAAVANVTPVAPTQVTPIEDEEVAAADKVPEVTEEKEPELKTITDEDTALSAGESDCWIHWLILIITLLYTVYTLVRAYARHKKIKELQDGEEAVEVNA